MWNPAGVVVQYRRDSSSRVRPPTGTPSPRPMKGLHDLAPRRRRASEGSQAGGIRRFAARRPPRGRLGSVRDVGKRRHRMRGRFHRWIQIKTGPQQCADEYHDPPKFWIQSSLESTERSRMRPRYHSTSDLSQRESESRYTSEKSKQFGPDGAPFPSKTSITRGPPVVAAAVSLDPILPQR